MLRYLIIGTTVLLNSLSYCQNEEVLAFENFRIEESSGIEYFDALNKCLITHNDSGGEPELFFTDTKGKNYSQATKKGIILEGAKNRDWEDISWRESDSTLIVADIGDNMKQYSSIYLYTSTPLRDLNGDAPIASTRYTCHYPKSKKSGKYKKYNAEAFTCLDEGFLIISKDPEQAIFFTGVWPADPQEDIILKKEEKLKLESKVTGADYNNQTHQLVVLSYDRLFLFALDTQSGFDLELIKKKKLKFGQCEAVAWVDDTTIVITNENGRINYLDLEEL